MIPTLIGISFVTFLLMELAPGDATTLTKDKMSADAFADAKDRAARVLELKKRHGHVDAAGNELSMGVRYWRWLRNASQLRFAGDPVASKKFREQILEALPITLLLNGLALLFACAIAIPLGTRAGMRPGSGLDRIVSAGSFVALGVPEFLTATLLLLVFCGGFFAPLLPTGGLGANVEGSVFAKLAELGKHLLLPVATLAIGYGVVLFRFLRESVSRAAESDFVVALRGFGAVPALVRQRATRNGLSPIVTLLGGMVPTLVGGTVVVEKIFSLPGIGWLTTNAVRERDMPMVMALTMLVSGVTLISLLISDLVQRAVDPRVELR